MVLGDSREGLLKQAIALSLEGDNDNEEEDNNEEDAREDGEEEEEELLRKSIALSLEEAE